MPDAELVPLVAARLEADGLAKPGSEGAAFVAFATQVAKGSMELVNDATKIVGDVLTYPVRVAFVYGGWLLVWCGGGWWGWTCVYTCTRWSEGTTHTYRPTIRRVTSLPRHPIPPHPTKQLAETLASGEAASLVEEGLWDMAREVVRAYEAGEMPKGGEGACGGWVGWGLVGSGCVY